MCINLLNINRLDGGRKIFLNVLFVLFFSISSTAATAGNSYAGPKCVGSYCLTSVVNGDSLEKKILKDFGEGYIYKSKTSLSRCYVAKVNKKNVYVRVDYGHGDFSNKIQRISINYLEICPGSKIIKGHNVNLSTEKKLALGDSGEKVIKDYGNPDQMAEVSKKEFYKLIYGESFGSTKLCREINIYSYLPKEPYNDLLHSNIFLHNGMITGIEISVTP